MKTTTKTKFAFWWWRKFYYQKPKNDFQKISANGGGEISLLLILPKDNSHLFLALQFIKSLVGRGHSNKINKIIGWEEQTYSIDYESAKKLYIIMENDVNKYGLLNDSSIPNHTQGDFTVMINLDPIINPISYQLIGNLGSIHRFGFGTNIDKDIYNVTIETGKQPIYIEQGYKYMQKMLGL